MSPFTTAAILYLACFGLAVAAEAASGLAWKTQAGHRSAELAVVPSGQTGFTPMSPGATGLLFTNLLADERGLTNQIFMSGSGVAAGDVDGDGWCDLFFCGLDSPNALYRNLGGWKFEDVTAGAGVACAEQASTGAVLADVDGDGDLDLLITGIGSGAQLFINDGQGHFKNSTVDAGLASQAGSMSMALADIDGDGDLDLYVANYRSSTLQDEPGLRFRLKRTPSGLVITMIEGRPVTPAELNRYSVDAATMSIREHGEADALYLNDGHGRFAPLSWTDGSFLDEEGKPVTTPYDWSLSVMFRDLNGDGAPDIYVCNDTDSIDRIWINNGRGRFQAIARLAIRQTCLASMGVDFADLNRDGYDEFFVADMLSPDHATRQRQMIDRGPLHPIGAIDNRPQYMRNTLFLNRGDGTYAELAQFAGVEASDWSWMPVFLDVDLDGYEDLLITTGLEHSLRDADARRYVDSIRAQPLLSKREFQESRKIMPRLDTPNHAFRNRGDLTFEDAGAVWGFNSRQVSHGMALADLDNDGDLDVAINCMNAPALIYRNDAGAPRVAVRLHGGAPNTAGIGAKIRVTRGPVPQSQEMISGGRYLSSDEALRVFAAGKETNVLSIEVTWRSGRRSSIHEARPNHLYEIDETGGTRDAKPGTRNPEPGTRTAPLFKDSSALLDHRHFERPFNDFERQPSLPRRFSQLGPGVSWCDFDGDGRDDLIVGAGRGGELAVFINDGHGGFRRDRLGNALDGDSTTVLCVPSRAGTNALLIGVSHYETGATNSPSVLHFEVSAGGRETRPGLPGGESSVGPMALADVDSDGDLDLFVGGRVVAGRYPEAATSRLYRREAGGFSPATDQRQIFDKLGLVSAAVFSDLNGDGFPELILACEWGPVKILRNDKGKLADWDPAITLPAKLPAPSQLETSTLRSPATEDGRNSKLETLSKLTGWWNSVTTGDFDGDGRADLVAGNWGRNSKYQRVAAQPLRIYFGDVNGEGRVEVVEAYHDRALGKVVPWRSWETLVQSMPFVLERFRNSTEFSSASVDEILADRKAGMKELAVTTLDSMVFLNRGDHFEARPLPMEAQWSPVFGINVGDLDGDGHEDVFLSQNFFGTDVETSRFDAGRGLWLKGDGRGGFTAVPGPESGVMVYGEQRGSALADYDGDGRVDLVVTQNGAATRLFHNEQARPGLRVRLAGPGGNPAGIGAALRLGFADKEGPLREVRAGGGYWSQDSATQVLALPQSPTHLWVRWPGGRTNPVKLPAAVREVVMDVSGNLKVVR